MIDLIHFGPGRTVLLGFAAGFAGYLAVLLITRSRFAACAGCMAASVAVAMLFWTMRISASNMSEVALNLSLVLVIVLYVFGVLGAWYTAHWLGGEND